MQYIVSIVLAIALISLVRLTSGWLLVGFIIGFLCAFGLTAYWLFSRNPLFMKFIGMDMKELEGWLK